ncbi:MAG: glutathione S-transferase N-terminal domain-containing protein [Acidiferrobacterales bacterium]|nr:glutathione S-transferase N-terminal domain-containing protein [Acidiferrobacterales bacterium]
MIDFYYWPTPNGHKISLALEEMQLEYRVKPINILKGEQHDPKFIALSPNNRVPAIVDHNGPNGAPHSVFESGAILLYLAQKYNKLWPTDPVEQSEVTQWLFFQCANVGPMFGQCGYFNGYASERVEHAIKRYVGETKRLYGLIDRRLAVNEYLVGENYSLADIATYPWMLEEQHELHSIDATEFPNVQRWTNTIAKRPGVQRGLQLMADDLKVGNPSDEARDAFFNRK